MAIATPFIMIGKWSIIPNVCWKDELTRSAFPIYLIHMFFIKALGALGCSSGILFDANTVLGCFGEWLSTVVLSFLSAEMIRRGAPRLSAIIFG